ncbi:MAG TPA: hypothetical protein VKB94_06090 [Rhizomicrobium sp.]|nr:hypothetical protein [Rhizomicrobium sp.]
MDENEGAESAPGVAIDPSAIAPAFAGTSREEADAFLDDRRALVAGQRHHLQGQVKHLHLEVLPVAQFTRAATLRYWRG